VNETPQPREIEEYPYRSELDYIRMLEFEDDSSLMYYPDGKIRCWFKPWDTEEEPQKIPKAYLYYWQVERNRPDITTWEQMEQVKKKGE
jgi:hypothetical protein